MHVTVLIKSVELPRLMQTVNRKSELVCRYAKLHDNKLCVNVAIQMRIYIYSKCAKYNVHGPLGRNQVHVYKL